MMKAASGRQATPKAPGMTALPEDIAPFLPQATYLIVQPCRCLRCLQRQDDAGSTSRDSTKPSDWLRNVDVARIWGRCDAAVTSDHRNEAALGGFACLPAVFVKPWSCTYAAGSGGGSWGATEPDRWISPSTVFSSTGSSHGPSGNTMLGRNCLSTTNQICVINRQVLLLGRGDRAPVGMIVHEELILGHQDR